MFFSGYIDNTKDYRLYNVKIKKLIITRDINFNEKESWNWNKNEVQKKQYVTIHEHTRRQSQRDDKEITPQMPITPSTRTTPTSNIDASPSLATSLSESPLEGWRLSDIYNSCNFVSIKSAIFKEAKNL